MRLSGVYDRVDEIISWLESKPRNTEEAMRKTHLHISETLVNVTEAMEDEQRLELAARGYTLLNAQQAALLYDDASPIGCREICEMLTKLKLNIRFWAGTRQAFSAVLFPAGISYDDACSEENATEANCMFFCFLTKELQKKTFQLRELHNWQYDPTLFEPAIFKPAIQEPTVIGPTLLSPALFSPAILSPEVMNPPILSPDAFNPPILSPLLLAPVILSPSWMSPTILTPDSMAPAILSPVAFSPQILGPQVMSPSIVSPTLFSHNILSPQVMNPPIVGDDYYGGDILSPGVLSRR